MAGLKRVLPLRTAVSTSAGLASAAINFLAVAELAGYAGGRSGWLAILVAGVLVTLAAGNFSELTALYPSAAAIRVWIRRGASDQLSMVASLVYVGTVVFVIAADAFVLGHVFLAVLPEVPGLVWIAALLGLVTLLNLRGIKVAGWVQDLNGLFLLGSLVVVALLALGHVPAPHWHTALRMGPNWIQALALGVFVFVGFEWVTPLAEEFQDSRVIPRGMFMALGLVTVAFGLFALAAQMVLPAHGLATSPVPQLLLGRAVLGGWGFWWMVVVSLTTAMTTFNGGLATASRFLYAAARERLLPPVLSRLNDRLVPKNALVALAAGALVLAAVVYATGVYTLLINVGAAVESFMYALAAWLVLSLRHREPHRRRTFRVPGLPWATILTMVVFVGLGVGAATTASGIPGPVPWPLVFVAVLTGLALWYVRRIVPRLKSPVRPQATPARPEV